MKIAIRYYSSGGNTKKLADAIGEEVGCEVLDVKNPLEENVDILFLGSAVYAAGIADEVKSFIRDNKAKIGKIVNFSTAAALPSTYKQVKKVADENGVNMANAEFHCRGQFLLMHKGKPDSQDLANIKTFARNIIK